MNTTPTLTASIEHVFAYADASAYKAKLRHDLADGLADVTASWTLHHLQSEALSTICSAQQDFTQDTLMMLAEAWADIAAHYEPHPTEARFAGTFAAHLTRWAIRMGDIGEDQEEWEVLPLEEPVRVPEPEKVPA